MRRSRNGCGVDRVDLIVVPASFELHMIERSPIADRVHPCLQRRSPVEGADRSERLEVGLLHDVVGSAVRSGDRPSNTSKIVIPKPDEFAEGSAVTGDRLLLKLIGNQHRNHLTS